MPGVKNQKKLTYEESHKIEGGKLYKLCNICEDWFPCTEEYFYKTNSKNPTGDGLFPYCKKCNCIKVSTRKNNNKEKTKKDNRNWYLKNKEYAIKNAKQYRIDHYSRTQNSQTLWRKNNKDKIKLYNLNREQHKKHVISTKEWKSCKEYFNNCCAYCGISNKEAKELYNNYLHKEHVNHEGANDLSNCVPACKSCNSSKNTYKLEDWYNESNIKYSKQRINKIHKWLHEDYKQFIKN